MGKSGRKVGKSGKKVGKSRERWEIRGVKVNDMNYSSVSLLPLHKSQRWHRALEEKDAPLSAVTGR